MTLDVYRPLIRFLQVKRSISSSDEVTDDTARAFGNAMDAYWTRSVNRCRVSALADDRDAVHRATRCVLRETSGNQAGLSRSRSRGAVPKQRIAAQIS